ncbi:unnamed protein product [Anisakis simplex]|uniref:F-box domain-containing protein n=1 Tax=Anisakis simplex TaxID=6269 RepID=A0A0M3KG26_ANISI|nr:unnamed protein product [Anisakis simplex]
MLHRLPAELRLIILENCDLLSLIHLRQVSTYYKCLAEEELRTRKRLDVNADYLTVFSDHLSSSVDTHHEISMEKLIDFLGAYMPQLCELSLRYCPVLLTLSSLIKVHTRLLLNCLRYCYWHAFTAYEKHVVYV